MDRRNNMGLNTGDCGPKAVKVGLGRIWTETAKPVSNTAPNTVVDYHFRAMAITARTTKGDKARFGGKVVLRWGDRRRSHPR